MPVFAAIHGVVYFRTGRPRDILGEPVEVTAGPPCLAVGGKLAEFVMTGQTYFSGRRLFHQVWIAARRIRVNSEPALAVMHCMAAIAARHARVMKCYDDLGITCGKNKNHDRHEQFFHFFPPRIFFMNNVLRPFLRTRISHREALFSCKRETG